MSPVLERYYTRTHAYARTHARAHTHTHIHTRHTYTHTVELNLACFAKHEYQKHVYQKKIRVIRVKKGLLEKAMSTVCLHI